MKRSLFQLNKSKIRQQLLSIFLLSTFIPLFLVGLFSILQARTQMSEQYEAQAAAAALRINSTLFDITTSLFTSCDNLLNSDYVRALFGSDMSSPSDQLGYDLVSNALKTMHATTAAIASVKIYTDNPNIPGNEFILPVVDNYAGQPWNNPEKGQIINEWQCLTGEDSGKNPVYELSMIRRIIISTSEYSAYLVLNIDSNYVKNRLITNDYLVMASVDNDLTFYSSDRRWLQQHIPFPSDFQNEFYRYTGPIEFGGKLQLTHIVTFLPYKTYNKFYICVSDPMAYENLNRITLIYIMILIAATLFPTLLTLLFSARFSSRVQTLRNAMHQVSLGDYNIMKMLRGDDELTETFLDLNTTVKKIAENEARFYESQILEQQLINKQQQMEFKMLASQINPHFLYNTLETIRMQALATGNTDVVTSIKLLGKSMHYVLENTGTDSTTLAKELEYIEVYLAIQKLRFGDRINYSLDYPEGMKPDQYKILPLLLQPIVENAVIHGLERTSMNGWITIEISLAGDNILIIKISDNGRGIDPVKLTELNERMNSASLDSTDSIGLYNINQRIKLLYGTAYGIRFESPQGSGTTVTITIPAVMIPDQE